MGEKEPVVRWLLNRILHTAGIYNYVIYEWIYLKESSIVMFLVPLTAKKLLQWSSIDKTIIDYFFVAQVSIY